MRTDLLQADGELVDQAGQARQGVLAPGSESNLAFAVPAGQYYFVVENRAAAPVAPLGMPLPFPETIGYVSSSAELGDRL